jgi:hypothetical protein
MGFSPQPTVRTERIRAPHRASSLLPDAVTFIADHARNSPAHIIARWKASFGRG